MYSGLLRWWPTLSARVPIASYLVGWCRHRCSLRSSIFGCAQAQCAWTQCALRDLQDEQVLVLVLVEGKHEGFKDESEVRHLVREVNKVEVRRWRK